MEPVKTGIDKSTILLYNRLCVVDPPTRNLCMFMLRDYVSHNKLTPGSILQRLVNMNISPITAMFDIHSQGKCYILPEDGLADTLNNLLLQENYHVKPWSHEYSMVKLLTRSF